jgi:hypothetical protein
MGLSLLGTGPKQLSACEGEFPPGRNSANQRAKASFSLHGGGGMAFVWGFIPKIGYNNFLEEMWLVSFILSAEERQDL